jgi:predicted LPLAT superfamily acyltransferase
MRRSAQAGALNVHASEAGDARVSQAWLQQRERGSVAAIRLLVGFAGLVGRPVARLALMPVCAYFLVFSVRARSASRNYLSRVLGRRPTAGELFQHYFTFATVALDRMFLLKERYDLFDLRLHGEEVMEHLRTAGRGCLLLGAHLGSFEVLRAMGTARQVSVALVMYEDNARMVGTVAKAINPALADNVIALGRFDSMLKVQERLQHSDWVGLLGDRALDEDGQLQVPFLGGLAGFSTAPFRIALMLKRPVVLMLGLYRGGNCYDLYFEKLFDPDAVGRAQREALIEQAVRTYAARLEHHCRDAPYNWFNFYDFWNGPAR